MDDGVFSIDGEAMPDDAEVMQDDAEVMRDETEAMPKDGLAQGTVKWFSRMKGWGFIEPDGGDRDVFVHYENIIGEGFRNLEKGERVRFRIEDTPKGPKATEVSSLEAPAAF